MTEITRDIAIKVRDTVDAGLVKGMGKKPVPGRMCVEAAVCFALGLKHGDDPPCVSPALRVLKINLNDARWSSAKARAAGLRRLAVAQLGSADALDDHVFTRRVADMAIRKVVPVALRASAKRNTKHAEALEAAAVRCELEGTRDAANAAAAAANAASAAYAANAAAYAAYAAAYAAYAAAADDAAEDAANAVAYAAYAAAADDRWRRRWRDDDDAARARNRVLAEFAEWVVEILIDMQAPGCQWLDLVPKEAA